MKTWGVTKVRTTFIEFFVKEAHTFVPSSSLVPFNDETLIFANSGMTQFKPIFQGSLHPVYSRAANSQKCIRAGGKHNDLDDVGKDLYHHTFFEMLGNWSFGDYFKKEAIEMAWRLLTGVYGLDPNRLYITYFEGTDLVPEDLEAKQLWLDIGVPEEHIIKGNAKDNFWEMGDTGPCGPCSEIHYDRIGGRNASLLVNKDDPDVLEIWNIVFMQYNREQDKSLRQLPNKHIDTGMGLERLVSILADVRSNYDTDVFIPIFKTIQTLYNVREYTGKVGVEDVDGIDTAYRVVADHLRTLVFAISDGALPSNEGRGILRRGARYIRKKFNVPIGNVFSSLMHVLIDGEMGLAFPEIKLKQALLTEILNQEEVLFAKTLDRGEALFDKIITAHANRNVKILDGADVWRLYDTFGFPIDLTRLMAQENNYEVDEAQVLIEEKRAKEISKAGKSKNAIDNVSLDVHALSFLEKNNITTTDDSLKYQLGNCTATVVAIFNNGFVDNIEGSSRFGVLLDKTNFYAEQGGQEYDTGSIVIDDKTLFKVQEVQLFGKFVLHIGTLEYGSLSVSSKVECIYDELRRWPIRNNHTGTHILNYALQSVVGGQVDQKGSLVVPDKLRFDYSANNGLSIPQAIKVEEIVNGFINRNVPVYAKEIPLQVGKSINGLRAVFGEEYPDPVRVVCVGFDVNEIIKDPTNEKWASTSIEFCGGTHVQKTSDIKSFVLIDESGISKGVRRIVAVTGEEAEKIVNQGEILAQKIADLKTCLDIESRLKTLGNELDKSVISLIKKSELKLEYNKIKAEFIEADKARKAKEMKVVVEQIDEYFLKQPESPIVVLKLDAKTQKSLVHAANHMKKLEKSGLLFTVDGDKITMACNVSKLGLEKGIKATEWIDSMCAVVGGKAGGRDDYAQGSGNEIDRIDEATNVAIQFAKLKF